MKMSFHIVHGKIHIIGLKVQEEFRNIIGSRGGDFGNFNFISVVPLNDRKIKPQDLTHDLGVERRTIAVLKKHLIQQTT